MAGIADKEGSDSPEGSITLDIPTDGSINKHPLFEVLARLIKKGNLAEIEEILNNPDFQDLDLNTVDQHGCTPLGYASKLGSLDIIHCFLKHGSSPRKGDYYKMTPLHYAAEYGHIAVADLLLSSGADVNAIEKPSTTPLHIAACKGMAKLAELLIKQGADVNKVDGLGTSALQGAAACGQLEAVKVLVEAGAHKNVKSGKNNRTALFLAAQVDHREIVEYLIEKEARVNLIDDYGMTAFCAMCIQNNGYLARRLCEAGSKVNRPDKKKSLPIHYTARNGDTDLTELLIKSGSAIDMLNTYSETPLHLAVRMGHTDTVKTLVKYGCDTNLCEPYAHVTALHVAVDIYQEPQEFEEVLKLLIQGGCQLDSRAFSTLESPLYRSIDKNKELLSIVLLQHGADPNVECPHDTSILNKACQRKKVELVSFLVDCDIDWKKEDWLYTNMHTSGVNTDSLIAEGEDETVPLILIQNVKLYHAIMNMRMNPCSLKHLCRLVIRRCIHIKLWMKIESFYLPQRLKDYLMMKIC